MNLPARTAAQRPSRARLDGDLQGGSAVWIAASPRAPPRALQLPRATPRDPKAARSSATAGCGFCHRREVVTRSVRPRRCCRRRGSRHPLRDRWVLLQAGEFAAAASSLTEMIPRRPYIAAAHRDLDCAGLASLDGEAAAAYAV